MLRPQAFCHNTLDEIQQVNIQQTWTSGKITNFSRCMLIVISCYLYVLYAGEENHCRNLIKQYSLHLGCRCPTIGTQTTSRLRKKSKLSRQMAATKVA